MKLENALLKGTLIKRYKRFLADVTLESGEIVTAHCPNSGSMKGYKEEGLKVWLSESDNPKRKLKYTWEIVEDGDGEKVMVHAARANALVREAVENGVVRELQGYERLLTEVKYGSRNSRIDLLLENPDGKCYVGVKSVTRKEGEAVIFPDAVTTRGQKHLEELVEMKAQGHRAVIFFAVLREGGTHFEAAAHIDPAYAKLLENAEEKGVEVLVYQAAFEGGEIVLQERLEG